MIDSVRKILDENYMKIKLVQTCVACPEQYEAFHGNTLVGYLRLRHGNFTVACPYVGDEIVYSASVKGDGAFYNEKERDLHLKRACKYIKIWINKVKCYQY